LLASGRPLPEKKVNVLPSIPAVCLRPNTVGFQQLLVVPAPDRTGMDIENAGDLSGGKHVAQLLIMPH